MRARAAKRGDCWLGLLRGMAWGLVVSLLTAGCGAPSETATATAPEHLEHHVPPHRPGTFAEGLAQVRRRVGELDRSTARAGDEGLRTQVQELAEILEWLPDLALDSDIRRRDWEEIQRHSLSLLGDYRRALAESGGGVPEGGLESPFRERLEQLEELAPRVREDPPPGEEASGAGRK